MRAWQVPVVALMLFECGAPNVSQGDGGTCSKVAGDDLPDDEFKDSNCDGIDGDLDQAIFVSVNGLDTNQGTKEQPMRTIQAALSRAVTNAKASVYVSEGDYVGPLTLVNGVPVYGGYSDTRAAGPAARAASSR